MSWIKVRKNNKEFLISTEAYNELFKMQGYERVEEKPIPTQPIFIKETKPKESEEKKNATQRKTKSNKSGKSNIRLAKQ